MYRLFRDATRYVDGHHTKDLFALNRDLKKVSNIFDKRRNISWKSGAQLLSTKYFCSCSLQVIVVDWNENTVAANRDNALILKKWEGDNTDRQLIGLTQLLQGIF